MLEIGQELQQGRYRIKERLTQGGMGTVYLATDRNLAERPVAIKENSDASTITQEQFQREAAMLARLTHPNLPRVTDYFIEPSGRQYLVMDYIPGEDLRQIVIRRGGQLPEDEALAWLDGVLSALEYMHGWIDNDTGLPRPIIHRDIKPSNIKRTPNGRIVLVDFGLAKYHSGDETQIGARAVTPGYSPLEQYTGGTDVRADIYALGATLYALLTGERPPDSPARASGAALPSPRQRNPTVSRNTERVLLRALQMQANERFQSVQEMRAALAGRSLFSRGGEADPTSSAGWRSAGGETRRTKRARAGIWIGALSLLALLTFAVLVATMLPQLLRPNAGVSMPTTAPANNTPVNEDTGGDGDDAAPVAALVTGTAALTLTPSITAASTSLPTATVETAAGGAPTATATISSTTAPPPSHTFTHTPTNTPTATAPATPTTSPMPTAGETTSAQAAAVLPDVAPASFPPTGTVTTMPPASQVETSAVTPSPPATET
jgi:serine/threonine-protein kinase